LEQGPTEQKIRELCERERRPLPDAIANAPTLELGNELFYMAFSDLTSCRGMGQGFPGPIPWTAINTYCEVHGIEGEQREDVFYHVQHLDKSYLDWSAKRHKSETAKAASKPTKGKKR
jgi:hypothetical protein